MQDNASHYICTALILGTFKKKRRRRVELKVTLDFSYLEAKVSFHRVWICMYELLWKPDQSQTTVLTKNYVGNNRQWTFSFSPNTFHYLDGFGLPLGRKLAPILTNVWFDVWERWLWTSLLYLFSFKQYLEGGNKEMIFTCKPEVLKIITA